MPCLEDQSAIILWRAVLPPLLRLIVLLVVALILNDRLALALTSLRLFSDRSSRIRSDPRPERLELFRIPLDSRLERRFVFQVVGR